MVTAKRIDAVTTKDVAIATIEARPTADLGEERKRALDELRVAAQICEIDENPIVREQALRIRAARDVLSRSA